MQTLTYLIKPASGACNLRCRYCFYTDEMNRRKTPDFGRMSLETLEALVRGAMESSARAVNFMFQGGEPTLAGIEFFRELIRLEQQWNRKKIRISHSIQTNGMLLNEEWAEFFRENRFLVGLSLDGYRALHDRYRVDAGEQGTFVKVLQAAKLLERHRVEYNILCVVTRDAAKNAEKVYRSLRGNGFAWLQFIPCLDDLDCAEEEWSLTAADYGEFLKKTFELYWADLQRGGACSVRAFDNYVRMLCGQPPESCDMTGRCTAYLLVEGDGSVYPCDFYALDEWYLGNVKTDSPEAMLSGEKAVEFCKRSESQHEACAKCRWVALCRGGCCRHREPMEHGIPAQNRFCESYRAFFEFAYPKLQSLARWVSNNERSVF